MHCPVDNCQSRDRCLRPRRWKGRPAMATISTKVCESYGRWAQTSGQILNSKKHSLNYGSYQLTVRRHLWAVGIMAHQKLLRLRARSSTQKSTGEAVALALMIGKDPQLQSRRRSAITNSAQPTWSSMHQLFPSGVYGRVGRINSIRLSFDVFLNLCPCPCSIPDFWALT
jgi:hypothetical protein